MLWGRNDALSRALARTDLCFLMKEVCFVWVLCSVSFLRVVAVVGFGPGCRPRVKEYPLLFNGKSCFCTLVETAKSCGLR